MCVKQLQKQLVNCLNLLLANHNGLFQHYLFQINNMINTFTSVILTNNYTISTHLECHKLYLHIAFLSHTILFYIIKTI